ncbi:MAG: flagellar biosynthetic protein FliR [Candidatus Marinamargulisbacteria bacterium]
MIISQEQIVIFFLIFARIIAVFLLTPGFSGKEIFSSGKISMVFWIAFLLVFVIPLPLELPGSPILFFLAIFAEFIIGAMIGFLTQLLILGIEFGGSIMDTQAGLSVASLLDPSTGQTTSILSRLVRHISILVFFIINGHHVVLGTLVQSFRAIPITSKLNIYEASGYVVSVSVDIFIAALQIAAPIMLVVFLIDFGFGLLSRVAPQVNVFQLGFQVKPLVSLFVMLTIIPGMVELVFFFLQKSAGDLLRILYLIRS